MADEPMPAHFIYVAAPNPSLAPLLVNGDVPCDAALDSARARTLAAATADLKARNADTQALLAQLLRLQEEQSVAAPRALGMLEARGGDAADSHNEETAAAVAALEDRLKSTRLAESGSAGLDTTQPIAIEGADPPPGADEIESQLAAYKAERESELAGVEAASSAALETARSKLQEMQAQITAAVAGAQDTLEKIAVAKELFTGDIAQGDHRSVELIEGGKELGLRSVPHASRLRDSTTHKKEYTLSAVGDDASMTPLSYTLPEPVDIPAVPDVLAEPEPAAEE